MSDKGTDYARRLAIVGSQAPGKSMEPTSSLRGTQSEASAYIPSYITRSLTSGTSTAIGMLSAMPVPGYDQKSESYIDSFTVAK